LYPLYVALVFRPDEARYDIVYDLFNVHMCWL
jgi:hypothetical protein